MPTTTFSGIVSLCVSAGNVRIHADGTITGVTKAEKSGTTLKLGGAGGSGGGHVSSISQFNGSGGGSVMVVGNLRITSRGDGVSSLEGPADKRIEINGHETTFGQIVRWCQGGSTLAAQNAATPAAQTTYKIEASTIREIECTGAGGVAVAAPWLASSLSVSLRGSGDVELPSKTFQSLTLSLMGSGDICGENETSTYAQNLVAALMGSGDIKDVTVLGSGTLSLMGSGDIDISAVDPSAVTRSRAGSGDISVNRVRGPSLSQQLPRLLDSEIVASLIRAVKPIAKPKAKPTPTSVPTTTLTVRDMGADDVDDLIAAQPDRKRERESSPEPAKRAKK